MTTVQIWGLVGIGVGVLLGGATQTLTGWLEHRRSIKEERWRLKSAAYLDLLARAEAVVGATAWTGLSSVKGESAEATKEEGTAVRALAAAQVAVEMYGSTSVARQSEVLLAAVGALRHTLIQGSDANETGAAYEDAHRKTLAMMRAEING